MFVCLVVLLFDVLVRSKALRQEQCSVTFVFLKQEQQKICLAPSMKIPKHWIVPEFEPSGGFEGGAGTCAVGVA